MTASCIGVRSCEETVTLAGRFGNFARKLAAKRVNAADPDHEINHAPHRFWFVHPDNVRLAAVDGTTGLAGAVQPSQDREAASATAWAAPGAAAVLNDIALKDIVLNGIAVV